MHSLQGAGAEFRRGWKPLVASSVGIAGGLSGIAFYTFGVFVGPLTAEFGWTRGQTAAGASALTIATAITAPIVGTLIDKYGAKRIGLISMLFIVLGYVALTQLNGNIFMFYLTWLILALLGGGTTPVVWTRAVNLWFDKARGLALGLCLAGSGLTGIFGPIYVTSLISRYGWQAGYLGLAAVILIVCMPLIFLLFQERPADGAVRTVATSSADLPGMTAAEALRSVPFWKLGLAFFGISAILSSLIVNIVPLLTDRGMTAMEAAGIASILGIAVVIGRVGVGFLVDRFSATLVALVMLILASAGCLLLAIPDSPSWAPVLAVAAFGLAIAMEVDLLAFMTSRYFGMKAYGKIYGFQISLFYFAAAVGPLSVGLASDAFSGYREILYISSVVLIVGALVLLSMGKPQYPAPNT